MNALESARAYLSKLPSAISGAGGHQATFRAACECVRFGLSDGAALTLLREWNGTHCQPPWTERELAHKVRDARRLASYEVRIFTGKPAVRTVWKIDRKTPKSVELAKVIPPMKPDPVGTAEASPNAQRLALRQGDSTLPPDQAAWLPVSRQILIGEFDGCDRSTRESLTIGLRSVDHSDCQRALARLL